MRLTLCLVGITLLGLTGCGVGAAPTQPASSVGSTSVAPVAVASATVATPAKVTTRPAVAPAVVVPGLDPRVVQNFEMRSAVKKRIDGMAAYYVTLSSGRLSVIHGFVTRVVPKIMSDGVYNPNAALFFHAGSFLVYVPDGSGMPDSFNNHLGPFPGMTIVDTDVDLSTQ